MELRQERRAGPGQGDRGHNEQRQRRSDHHARMIQHWRQHLREPRLQHPGQPTLVATLNRRRIGQERDT